MESPGQRLTLRVGPAVVPAPDESLSQLKAEVRRELKKTRQAILQVSSELDDIDDRPADLPRLEQTLERFQEAGQGWR